MAPRPRTRREYETPEILLDAPLRDEGTAHFHFDDFAATLARLIAAKGTPTPLTICVTGPWGAGKTSLLHRLQRQLDGTGVLLERTKSAHGIEFINPHEEITNYRVCRTVWFNAWKYANEDELLVALVRRIVQTMADDSHVKVAIRARLLDPTYPRRDVLNTVLSWFAIKTPLGEFKPNTGQPQPTPFSQHAALLDLFDNAFNNLLTAWVHHKAGRELNPQKGVLVVFIDDLDRCLPEKTVQVLEAIKLFLDRPGCIFVIGADVELVRQAVESHYQNTRVTGLAAGDYLDKIIQLRFSLPPLMAGKMEAYLKEMAVGDEMLAQWQTLIAAAEINPRRVKAVVNDIELQWKMLLNSGQAESIQQADFIRWNALLRAAPSNFREQVFGLEDPERRHSFILDALRWGQEEDDEVLNRLFVDFERDGRRLRRVLKQIGAFSDWFNAEALDAIIHLTALASRTSQAVEVGGVDETVTARDEVVVGKGRAVITEMEGKSAGEATDPGRVADRRVTDRWVVGGLEFCRVPAGKFLMGSQDDNRLAYDEEKPQHTLDLDYDYWIGRFPVTNRQFQEFVRQSRHRTNAEEKGSGYIWNGKDWVDTPGANWQHPDGPDSALQGKETHPVVHISWFDANAYCQWFNATYPGDLNGLVLRLPTEAEWEKAARGPYGWEWPWGNDWDPTRCNSKEKGPGGATPVGQYSPQGDSPFGAADMAGNVWEWTRSLYKEYSYNQGDGREDPAQEGARVVRGGSFGNVSRYCRSAFRDRLGPDYIYSYIGFRVCLFPSPRAISLSRALNP